MTSSADVPSELRQRLAEHDQEHLLASWSELGEQERADFAEQLRAIDLTAVAQRMALELDLPEGGFEPCPSLTPTEDDCLRGEEAIGRGLLGVLTVAGGQGTRLGWSGPKGTFPAAAVTGKSLFQLIAEQILFAQRRYGVVVPWYIMTSVENDGVTRSFLLDNNCFGLDRTDIFIFPQGCLPAVDAGSGRVLLAGRGEVAMSPDGHGGVVDALRQSGGLEQMHARGVEHLSYVQIDNPLVHAIDPGFLGLHMGGQSSGEASSKVVCKTDPAERVGVLCRRDGRTMVVEYSDLPVETAQERNRDGCLRFDAASIAVHLFSTTFLRSAGGDLPWHRAVKKVSCFDVDSGRVVQPKEPNAVKFERFVFDLLPRAERSVVMATPREEEFAPIKNASGSDSPQTSKQMQVDRAARWLESRGMDVPRGDDGRPVAMIEISPLTAAFADQIPAADLPAAISPDLPTAI